MKKRTYLSLTVSLLIAVSISLLLLTACDNRTTEPKQKIKTPQFSPQPDVYIDSVLVTITCETQDVKIYYTIDESEPKTSSILYTEPVRIDSTLIVKARAFRQGWENSDIETALYEIRYSHEMQKVEKPVFSPAGGNYADSVIVTITTDTEEALIHYTLDGSEPDEDSNLYTSPIVIDATSVIKARAYKEGWLPSDIVSGVYGIINKVATPTFSPEAGVYEEKQQVEIFCATENAVIYYTLDGQEPTESSFLYEEAIIIEETTLIKAKAFKGGLLPSVTATAEYTIKLDTVATPEFDPPAGQYTGLLNVRITCSTDGATIRYTTTGLEPTENSSLYVEPVAINAITTLRAKAFKEGWNPSETAVAVYDMKVASPTFDPPSGIYKEAQYVEIISSTPDAQIHYTTDGTEPTFLSEIYTEPLHIIRDTVIRAIAFRSNWSPSNVTEAEYVMDYPDLPDMVLVHYGTFKMGDRHGTGRPHELPVHEVTIDAFHIGRYQVTQKQWVEIMGENPSGFNDDLSRPVDSVCWYRSLIYCNLRSIAEGLTPVYTIRGSTDPGDWGDPPYMGYDRDWDNAQMNINANGYRLPTEAEWEYAARGAVNEPDYIFAGSNNIDEVAWFNLNSNSMTHPVGLKQPNGLDIYDMSGNVWEWCWDWYGEEYYQESPDRNPEGPNTGSFRIIRGGSWSHSADNAKVSSRMNGFPYRANNFMGLRVVRSLR